MKYCCVPDCFNAKSKSNCRSKTFFRFPLKNSRILKFWLKNIRRRGFVPSPHSLICSDHFEEKCFTICPFTKRRKLKQKAAPTIFPKTFTQPPKIDFSSTLAIIHGNNQQLDRKKQILPCAVPPSFPFPSPSISSDAPKNPDDKAKIKDIEIPQTGIVNLQEVVIKEECGETATVQEPHKNSDLYKPDFLTFISNKSAIILLPSNENQISTAISGTESQNVAGTSIVIKQPIESTEEPPRLAIKEIHPAEEITPPSSNSSHIRNKRAQKRKINNAQPDGVCTTPKVTRSKLRRRSIRKPNSRLHPPTGTAKKFSGDYTLPTNNDEDATREMLQSLLNDSENNPLFGSSSTERPGDLFDVFADFIAGKLRKMDWDDCAFALRAIMDAVFKHSKDRHDNEAKNDIPNPRTN